MGKTAKKLRLMIVDDHELVRHGTRGILRAHPGWLVVGEAADGKCAVQMAETLLPDLAILDIAMPNLDGLEATRQILKVAPNTKVLILTMHDSFQMVRRILEAGAQGYVLKTDLAANLVRAVSEVSQGKLFLTPRVSEIVLQGSPQAENCAALKEGVKVSPTPREFQVIRLLAQGKSNKESASLLNISTRTVESYRARVMRKLKLKSTAEVVRYAIRNKIVEA
jgi:DNA-binding NarL/FixJ family response regulator